VRLDRTNNENGTAGGSAEAFARLAEEVAAHGTDVDRVLHEAASLKIETPSWGYGDTGTRFGTFPYPGAARDVYEKVADAALVHSLTGVCPTVALHIPWDTVDDWSALRQYAETAGVSIGSINPNLFQDHHYKLGSLSHPDTTVRLQARQHLVDCVDIAREAGSSVVSLWLADGTSYAGQDDMRSRKHRLQESLQDVYGSLPGGMRLLIEYKLFEPAFYHTDLADWGMAHSLSVNLGPQVQVLVDMGHHAQGTNIEHIVAHLLDEGRLGGLHFNGRKYGDDDLIVGSVNPFELFCVFCELRWAQEDPAVAVQSRQVAYMIDQSHNIEPKLEAMVQSVVNIQTAHVKSWLVDGDRLRQAQENGDVLRAHRALMSAFETDVRPLVAEGRRVLGVEPDPIDALRRGGHQERLARQRHSPHPSPSGYPSSAGRVT